jgi:hypothetical protein
MFNFIKKRVNEARLSHQTYKKETGNSIIKVLFDKGLTGEYLSFFALNHLPGEHKTLFNVYVPKRRGGHTEIDLIFIHETGVYVIESKNYSAWIYGNGDNKNWTQVFPNGKKYPFYNPIKQNETHIRALQFVLPEVPLQVYENIIVFSERCKLKSIVFMQERTYVIRRPDLKGLINRLMTERQVIFTKEQVQSIYQQLKRYAQADEQLIKEHHESIKQKYKR